MPPLLKKSIKSSFRIFLLVKIWFWDGFGPILDLDSNSAWKTAPGDRCRSIFHRFSKIRFFQNVVFPFLSAFEWYFEVRELDRQTQHEKTRPGSYSQIFWSAGRPVGARRRSLLIWPDNIDVRISQVLSIFPKTCMGAHKHPPKLEYSGCNSQIPY